MKTKNDGRQADLLNLLKVPRIKTGPGQMRRATRGELINPNGPPDPCAQAEAYKRRPKMIHPCAWSQSLGGCTLHPDHCPNLIAAEPIACPRFEIKGQNVAQVKSVK
jgi:hypothetical protein